MNTTELQELINDFGGGREKANELSQKFYDVSKKTLLDLHNEPYEKIEMFAEYLKAIAKKLSTVNILGVEKPID